VRGVREASISVQTSLARFVHSVRPIRSVQTEICFQVVIWRRIHSSVGSGAGPVNGRDEHRQHCVESTLCGVNTVWMSGRLDHVYGYSLIRAGQQDCPRNAAHVAASTCEVTGSPASAWKRPTAAAVSAVYVPQRPGSPTDGSALIDPTL